MRTLVLSAIIGFTASAAAQTVWNVSPPANLDQVFAGAAPGDIVVLATGSYGPFTLTKGLTVIGPAVIEALPFPATPITGPWDTTLIVPVGQQARLVGLDFRTTLQPLLTSGISGHAVLTTGDVSIEDCLIGPGSVIMNSGTLLLQRCTVRSDWRMGGLQISGGVCNLSDCTLHGWDARNFGTFTSGSGAALIATGGTVIGSRVTLTGGAGAGPAGQITYFTPASPGVQSSGTSNITLTDSTVTGGSGVGAGPGAVGIAASAAIPLKIARSTVLGGQIGNVQQAPDQVGLAMDHGFVRGQTSTVTATAGSSQQVLAILGGYDATAGSNVLVSGPVFGVQSALSVLGLFVPAAGAPVGIPIAVPNTVILLGATAWLQALQLSASGSWVASPLVGGVVR